MGEDKEMGSRGDAAEAGAVDDGDQGMWGLPEGVRLEPARVKPLMFAPY